MLDEKLLGYLGRALSLELSAVQMYSFQARLATSWGLDEPAGKFRHEAKEEMQHVERIIARMLALGVAPGASQLRPAPYGRNLLELLQASQAFEIELVTLYSEAANYAALQGRKDDRLFFQQLMEEELAHGRELAVWIEEIEPTQRTR